MPPTVTTYHTFDVPPPPGPGYPPSIISTRDGAYNDIEAQMGDGPPPSFRMLPSEAGSPHELEWCSPCHIVLWMFLASVFVVGFMFVFWDGAGPNPWVLFPPSLL
jgi:hypothetical protein